MKKKNIIIAVIVAIILIGIFVLISHNKNSEDSKNMHVLSLYLGGEEFLQVRVDYPNRDDVKLVAEENDINHATIINESKEYKLFLELGDALKDDYYAGQESDKKKDGYTSAKFADNDGYYLVDNNVLVGNVLIDTQTNDDYKFINFQLTSETSGVDILKLFKDKEIQEILASFGHRYAVSSESQSNNETTTTSNSGGSVVGQWSHYSYVYTFNEDGTGTYNAGTIMNFTYENNGKQLSILFTGNTSPTVLDYRLDGNKLIITDSFGDEVVYVKD